MTTCVQHCPNRANSPAKGLCWPHYYASRSAYITKAEADKQNREGGEMNQGADKIEYPVVLGWFIGRGTKEAYDPGIDVPCPYCGLKLTDDNVRTHNLMAADREPMLSVFYRTHKTCHEEATDRGKQALDDFVMAALETMRPMGKSGDEAA